MGITKSIKSLFLSIAAFLILVWGRVRYLLPSHPSNSPPPSSFDPESQALETQPYAQVPLTINQTSQNPENQPLHSDTIAPEPEMLQPPLQALHPSHIPPSSPAVDLESQLPEAQAESSLALNQEISVTLETQPSHFTAMNTETLLRAAETQSPQPRSGTEIELLPLTQQRPSPAINSQQINMVIVRQITLEWPNVIMGFCFEAAIQIALQYETTQHAKLPVSFYLRSFSILFTFTSLFISQIIRNKLPDISKVLEKVAIFLAAIAFFTTIGTPLTLGIK